MNEQQKYILNSVSFPTRILYVYFIRGKYILLVAKKEWFSVKVEEV